MEMSVRELMSASLIAWAITLEHGDAAEVASLESLALVFFCQVA